MFMLSYSHLVELDEAMEGKPGPSAAKKSKAVAGWWPTTHEELYTLCGVEWPPDLANFQFAGLRTREQEVSFLAHKAFPPEGGDWEFLDANHSVERLFRWPPKNQKVPLLKDAMRNPWKNNIPTFTTTSNIMCRKVLSSGQLVLRRIHPLE